MITKDMLNDIQAEFGKVGNLAAALSVVVDMLDVRSDNEGLRQISALAGVSDAIADQMKAAQSAFETLFVALREGEEGAA